MSAAKDVLLLPGWGPGVGGGHVVRCLSLAEALETKGVRCVFALPEAGRVLLARIAGADHAAIDIAVALSDLSSFSHVVLDDYAADASLETKLRADGRRLLVIDDLAERPRAADLTINPGALGADPYADFGSGHGVRLLGPRYALLRPMFAAGRDEALKAPISGLRRLFVSFGLSDVGGVSARAYAAIRRWDKALEVHMVVGSGAQSLMDLQACARTDPKLQLHIDAAKVAALLGVCDAALGGGGVGAWERACLGRPSVALSVAPNQDWLIDHLGALGAHIRLSPLGLNFEAELTQALHRLKSDDVRAKLKSVSSALCDGRGAQRVAEAFLSL